MRPFTTFASPSDIPLVLLTFLAASLFPLNAAFAVPPPHGFPRPEGDTCFVNRKASKERLAIQAKFAPGFAPPISATSYKVAALRIDFSDKFMTKTRSQTESFFNNLKNFYLENSYNLLTVTATVSTGGSGAEGSFRMPKTHAYYANGINSRYSELAQDAVAVATTSGFNLSSFDHVMLYHAGDGAETTSNSNIWSVYLPSSLAGGPTVDGKTFPGATVVPETEGQGVDPLGVICHEYGHQQGLPDLYNTATSPTTSGVGKWSLMDSGVYIGSPLGSNPAHLDAWSKQFLGYASPETINLTDVTSKSLTQAETSRSGFFRIAVSVSDVGGTNEYFLLEYRRKSGATYDTSLPGEGLLIWHVDDSIASNASRLNENTVNTNPARRGVDLIEADSSDPSTNDGDAGDPWPGSSNSATFLAPKSNAYNGKDSGIEVSKISSSGSASISMLIKNQFFNSAIANNSQPGSVIITGGEKGYANPQKGENALIGILPSSSGSIEVKIYSLTGDLTYETTVTGSANNTTIVAWNGKDRNGTVVSTGIYLVHINGGGINLKKKIAIAK